MNLFYKLGITQGKLKEESVCCGHHAIMYGGEILYLQIFFVAEPANQFL